MKIVRNLQMLICKALGIQYRHVLSEWELKNLVSRDARIYLGIGKDGVTSIIPRRTDSAADRSASNSLVYFLGREIYEFHKDVDRRLRKLNGIEPFTINAPQLTALDRLLDESHGFDDYLPEEKETEQPTLLEQYEQEINGDEEEHENEHS